MSWRAVFRPGMRAYFVPLVAGFVLALSIFLPWVIVGSESLRGFPDAAALWVAGLGLAAIVFGVPTAISQTMPGICGWVSVADQYDVLGTTTGKPTAVVCEKPVRLASAP